jgi:ribosomal protein S20
MATNPSTSKVVYENEDERKERLQKEKLKTIVREALEEFAEDRKKAKKDFFADLFGG